MKHIKTQMVLFTSMAIFLSCLLINLISTSIFARMYMKELYRSWETQAQQVMQNVDWNVHTLENSIQLLLNDQGALEQLAKTDFNRPSGAVYQSYLEVDRLMNNFHQQFPSFSGLIFLNSQGSFYKYNYYNRNMDAVQALLTPENIQDFSQTSRFSWRGVYPIQNSLAGENAYLVICSFFNYQKLRSQGLALVLLDEEIFSAIYQPLVENTGAKVYLFDNAGFPAESYPEGELSRLEASLSGLPLERGKVRQIRAADGQSLFTVVSSSQTGWSLYMEIPIRALTAGIRQMIVVNTALSVAIVAVFGLLMMRYISGITGHIVRLSQAMAVVEENHFRLRLYTHRKDEIGLVYEGFNTMSENLNRYFEKAVAEEKQKNDAEIRALFYQIKPHFLYNTLASIRMFAMKKGCPEIVDMLGTLNRLLRNTINIRDHFIPIEEEMAQLRDYMKIYNVRYNNRIAFSMEAPEELMAVEIPNMVIQPLVENAMEHGLSGLLSDERFPAAIRVRFFRQEGRLAVQVEDNGVGLTDMELAAVLKDGAHGGREGHIGLYNIDSRLKSLYGEGCGLRIESEKNRYTRVTLLLGKIGGQLTMDNG